MGSQLLATYHYNIARRILVYGCWDKETKEGQFDFYDVFQEDGICLNEGNPFHEWPTWFQVRELLKGFSRKGTMVVDKECRKTNP